MTGGDGGNVEPLRVPIYVQRPTRGRLWLSLGVWLALIGAGLHYLLRDTPDRGGVVHLLDGLGPVWPLAFGTATVAMFIGAVLRVGYGATHLLAGAVLVAYASALWWTAALGAGGWVTACMTTGLAVHTLVLAATYARDTTEGV